MTARTMWTPTGRKPVPTLKPGQFMDGRLVKTRCKYCGAAKVKGRCPVGKRDCGRP